MTLFLLINFVRYCRPVTWFFPLLFTLLIKHRWSPVTLWPAPLAVYISYPYHSLWHLLINLVRGTLLHQSIQCSMGHYVLTNGCTYKKKWGRGKLNDQNDIQSEYVMCAVLSQSRREDNCDLYSQDMSERSSHSQINQIHRKWSVLLCGLGALGICLG